jgi:NADH-quinone oxidoreductase subunit F
MRRFATVDELHARREELQKTANPDRKAVSICGGTGCTAFGSAAVQEAFRSELGKRGLAGQIPITVTGCHGFCEKGPIVVILPSRIFYPSVQVEDVPRIVERTVMGAEVIEELLYVDPATGRRIAHDHEVPFYAKQMRLVFRLNGVIHPTDLDDYIAHEGYSAAARSLSTMTPEQVIEEVRAAGLRGRGGAGFSTGVKWGLCRGSPGDEKYLICNADEGDPGAFMDRSVLEGTPHTVIEGMIIAARAIGASHGVIYVRAEYPLAVRNTHIALEDARAAGLLGENILGSGFSFDIEVREGAGAFVCGEETALIASLEGRRGMPRSRPPFPAQSGYKGKPTTINNVETFANVPLIILKGSEWYRAIGTEGSKGTKIFALAGKVKNTGLVEVPLGATLRQIVFDIGGGIPKDRKFKAAQMGGPSGGCVPAQHLDLPIDYESVKRVGAIMGSGGLIVMDETTCMVDIARYFLEFTQKESCGKCVPCRVGTRHMLDILTRICAGDGREGDIEELGRIGQAVKTASLCGLGQTAPNPVLSTIRHFRHEYEEHIRQKRCRASVCEALVDSPCQHACPSGVNAAAYVALLAENRAAEAAHVVRLRNPFVSVCGRVCDAQCERRCRRADVDEPIAIRALKRYAADNSALPAPPIVAPVSGRGDVAVVGGGPAGLSCAYFLALMGRPSVVFEALPIAGGMLAVGIPEYRLPRSQLDADVDFILSHGVELRTETPVRSFEQLRAEGFRAIFLGTGAHRNRSLRIPGEDLEGVVGSLDFLRGRALGMAVPCGRKVAVIGGGNAAVDAARSALRLGAEKVTILYRRTRAEMPAYEEEIEAALEEGVELLELVAPREIVGAQGRARGIGMVRMRLGDADENGRRQPVPVEGSEFLFPCDTVIPAVGQAPSVEAAGGSLALGALGGVTIDVVTGSTGAPGVFAGGDCVSGGGTVIEAVAAGQNAAVSIDRMLGGAGLLPANIGPSLWRPTDEQLERIAARVREPALAPAARRGGFAEVLGALDPAAACGEAARCMRCDLERAAARAAARGTAEAATAARKVD